jgi:hypothetical protein
MPTPDSSLERDQAPDLLPLEEALDLRIVPQVGLDDAQPRVVGEARRLDNVGRDDPQRGVDLAADEAWC